jgi:two-component system cell cycle response regulator CpdR
MTSQSMQTVTILYVEDNDDLRATIGELLRQPDRHVRLCASAEEALVADREGRFDIVVTDISLPGISGAELAQQLVTADPARWVVLCSGYDLAEHVRRFGPNVRAIMKPFEIDDLDALIDELCAAVRSSAAERFGV